MNELNGVTVLKRIRNCYHNIQMMTLQCISDDNPDAIPGLMHNRSEIMMIIESEERKMHDCVMDASCKEMRSEIRTIISSIIVLDKQLEAMARSCLTGISRELSALYKKSRATTAYASHCRC